ncbi:MAG: nucleoside deaminase [Pseudomonadota bacterium]
MIDDQFLEQAIALATTSVERGGGPFGAVVVKGGEVIGRGTNEVTLNNDPTAHAEVLAIRDACNNIGDFSLMGATLYASCEPCPMCLAAIYWARLDRIVYAASREDAAAAGFDDGVIAREIQLPLDERHMKTLQLDVDGSVPFLHWKEKEDKTRY